VLDRRQAQPDRRLAGGRQGFVEHQPNGTRIGLVTFAGSAALLVAPTTDKKKLTDAIDGLRTSRGTAIGLAILTALDAISEFNPNVPPTGVDVPPSTSTEYQPDTIVVLTDGRNTHGVDPVTAAAEAAARHVRVYTIGFGTTQPSPMVCTRDQISGDAAFRGDSRSAAGAARRVRPRPLPADRRGKLTEVADSTGGEYFKADDAEQLSGVLRDLPNNIVFTKQNVEITVWFAVAGALLVLLAVALAQWWNRSTPVATPTHPPAPSP
jgi:Ca-activated chloride channel family protein